METQERTSEKTRKEQTPQGGSDAVGRRRQENRLVRTLVSNFTYVYIYVRLRSSTFTGVQIDVRLRSLMSMLTIFVFTYVNEYLCPRLRTVTFT